MKTIYRGMLIWNATHPTFFDVWSWFLWCSGCYCLGSAFGEVVRTGPSGWTAWNFSGGCLSIFISMIHERIRRKA